MIDDKCSRFRLHFSESAFKKKLSEVTGQVRESAMILYWVLKEPKTPVWVKLLIVSALGHLIWPLDGVPDIVPIFGYSDDLAVMAALIITLEVFITNEIRLKARQ